MSVRVLQAMAGGPQGGAEEFFARLCIGLHRAGLDQRVAIRRHPERAARLRAAGIEPAEFAFGGPLDIGTRRAMRRYVAAHEPDVVLTWMNRATRFCPSPARGRGFVHVGRLGGYYDLKYYRRCRHLIGNTRGIVAYLRRSGWPAERTHYLPNFVSGETAAPASRAALETPDEAPLLLALGRLHRNKGFDVLLRALADLDGVWLWLAGSGPAADDLRALAARLEVAGRVRFLGWRRDVAALLAAADALVCPSRHEPLGNVVIEGWAHGVPVVAAAAAGPAELITDAATGLLVPVEDAAALAAALRRLLDSADLGATLAAGGRAAYEAEFTERAVVARYLDFFSRVAA